MSDDFEKISSYGEFGKKKKKKGKPKGNRFERQLAKELNSRFNTKEFTRTPGSGGFATSHKNLPQHLQLQGDLVTPSNFKFVIEAKSGYDVTLNSVFSKKSEIWKFIKQAKKESKEAKKPWILVYKKDYCKPLAFTEYKNVLEHSKTRAYDYFVLDSKGSNPILCCLWSDLLQEPDLLFFSS